MCRSQGESVGADGQGENKTEQELEQKVLYMLN